jgi:hypothetical protein
MERGPELAFLPAALLYLIRGAALWVLVPLSTLFWLVAWPWIFRYSKSLPQFVSWVDYNFGVFLTRGPLRLLIRKPYAEWLPIKRVKELTSRTRFIEFL